MFLETSDDAYLPIEDRLPGHFADNHSVAILPQTDGWTIMVGNSNPPIGMIGS